jgi:hypothetical protein
MDAGSAAGPTSSSWSACCRGCIGVFLQRLQAAFDKGELEFFGNLVGLIEASAFSMPA